MYSIEDTDYGLYKSVEYANCSTGSKAEILKFFTGSEEIRLTLSCNHESGSGDNGYPTYICIEYDPSFGSHTEFSLDGHGIVLEGAKIEISTCGEWEHSGMVSMFKEILRVLETGDVEEIPFSEF